MINNSCNEANISLTKTLFNLYKILILIYISSYLYGLYEENNRIIKILADIFCPKLHIKHNNNMIYTLLIIKYLIVKVLMNKITKVINTNSRHIENFVII